MPNRSPIATFLLIVALLRLVGGDLAVLQVAAWSQMILTRAPVMGVAEAVTTTFDGAHPCQMCTAIQQAREHESTTPEKPEQSAPESATSFAKLLVVEADAAKITPPYQDDFSLTQYQWNLPTLHGRGTGQPPTPPPRSDASYI